MKTSTTTPAPVEDTTSAEPALPAVGYVNPTEWPGEEILAGWRYLAYRDSEGRTVVPQCDGVAGRIYRYALVNTEEMTVYPLPEGVEVAPVRIGDTPALAFALRDGRVIIDREDALKPRLATLLRTETTQFGKMMGHAVAEFCADPELVALTAPTAWANMRSVSKGSADNWLSTTVFYSFRDALLTAYPDAAGDKWEGPVRDACIHLQDGGEGRRKAWLVLPTELSQAVAAQGPTATIDCPLGEATLRSLGYSFEGWVDGGDKPYRWKPPAQPPQPDPEEEESPTP